MNKLWRRTGTALSYALWPALVIYLRFGTRTRVLVRAENCFVLVQGWLDDDAWGLPGGGAHRGEELRRAAARELREETGISVAAEECVYLETRVVRHRGIPIRCAFFLVKLAERAELRAQPGEIVTAQWFRVSELETLRYKTDVGIARELLAVQK